MVNLTEEIEFEANRQLNTKPHLLKKSWISCLETTNKTNKIPNFSFLFQKSTRPTDADPIWTEIAEISTFRLKEPDTSAISLSQILTKQSFQAYSFTSYSIQHPDANSDAMPLQIRDE